MPLRNSTLVFLIKQKGNTITDICLAMKKRGFGKDRWNGIGGKVEKGESIEDAAKREAKEEIGVDIHTMEKVAELSFYFPHQPSFDQLVHTYYSDDWEGDPLETEEMAPKWFPMAKIPYESMWPDDIFWLPEVLKGEKVKASFTFGEGDVVLDKNVRSVPSLG